MKYVGWDWASQTHDVTVLDDTGAVLERWAFAHAEAGWATTIHRLHRHGAPSDLPVIIERTSGLVVDPRDLGVLAHRHALRPRNAPSASTPDRLKT